MKFEEMIYFLKNDHDEPMKYWTEAYCEACIFLEKIKNDNKFKDFIFEWDKKQRSVFNDERP